VVVAHGVWIAAGRVCVVAAALWHTHRQLEAARTRSSCPHSSCTPTGLPPAPQVVEEAFAKLDAHHTGRLAPPALKPFVQRMVPPGTTDAVVMDLLQQLLAAAEAARAEQGLDPVG
jgi:hypothetical protein